MRSKLIIIIMSICAVSLLLVSMVFVITDRINARQSEIQNLHTLAKVIASNNSTALLFDNKKAADENLTFLKHHAHIQTAAIYEKNSERFAAYIKPGVNVAFPDPGLQPENIFFWKSYVELITPIVQDNEQIGHAYIRSDIKQVKERLFWYLGIVTLVITISLLIAYLLSTRLQRFITDPILNLSATARQVTTDKNYSLRASGSGRDELGKLVMDFNEMLDQIQIRDNELKVHKLELEERVAKCTTQLDIARKKAESVAKRMEYHAHHDDLTGLPNRILLNDRINKSLAHARREQSIMGLLFLDLDRFKIINDSLGHAVGDQLLKVISKRLKNCVREEDTVARLGGDEFMILLPKISGSADARRIGNKIIDSLTRPVSCNGHELHITTSIGVSIYPHDGTDAETLLKHADISMYRAKKLGRNKLVYYTAEMNIESRRQMVLENNLRKALEREELELYYQPKIDISRNAIIGVEALLRWVHPTMGMISPVDFIPVAEDSGLIVPIGEWVTRTAFKQLAEWHAAGHRDLKMAVNLSTAQLSHSRFLDGVRGALDDSQLDPGKTELEITENVLMQDIESTLATLNNLKDMGISIAIDDFGTGYSSLSYLRRLPIDTVKIDQSFVRELPDNKEDVSIARAIIAMAKSLGLDLVAEGVETVRQLSFFRQQGVNVIQGYLFSKPLSAEDMLAMLEAKAMPGPLHVITN
ncbi:MAG: EAL domain-containing protein [Gammaproteobacteria bacterium]|nr:MAG: EAL domain-containing protein [Gammaproteobacteria bacterium]